MTQPVHVEEPSTRAPRTFARKFAWIATALVAGTALFSTLDRAEDSSSQSQGMSEERPPATGPKVPGNAQPPKTKPSPARPPSLPPAAESAAPVSSAEGAGGTEAGSERAAIEPEPGSNAKAIPRGEPAGDEPAGEGPAASPRRVATAYLPGQRSSWMPYKVSVQGPVLIRAAGQVSIGTDVSGPNGIRESRDGAGGGGARTAGSSGRVLPSAPYLSLIGRLCSDELCSAPFLVGSRAVVCPSNTGPTDLQLWTNNDLHVDGVRSLRRYSGTVGGFTVSVASEPELACSTSMNGSRPSRPDAGLASGQVLRGPEWRVSTRQAWWKPFFVPLGEPLRLRASGTIEVPGQKTATPNGIAASVETSSDVQPHLRSGENSLVAPNLPAHALIGRLCGAERCGPAFLVGADRIICPQPPNDDHLELLINHVRGPRGRLGGSLPVTSDMFELQARHGGFELEVSRAPDDACRSPLREVQNRR